MEITEKLLFELQNRLKVGTRRGVHLNAVPGRSRYKFDISRLSHIDEKLPSNFINSLLSEIPLKFKISWKDNVPDLNSLFEEDQTQLVQITKSFENLINQTNAIESEKGINTFGFGFPILVRRDQLSDKLTVAPILIWSLRVKRTKEFNTWEILRSDEDPIYLNEVLINHLQSDSKIEVKQIPSEHLDDGLIDKDELLDICINIIESINSVISEDLRKIFEKKLETIKPISDKKYYEKLPLTANNSFIDFGGLFSIFEVQKQNIINDYSTLIDLKGAEIDLGDLENHFFQPITSIETDPSQQSILNSLNKSRNLLIQGPPGTGKSQSLTAIIINALENHKKTIVVCEKRTALEVLQKSLESKKLGYQTLLINDIIKDRRKAVESVRKRVEYFGNRRRSNYKYFEEEDLKEPLDSIIKSLNLYISDINKRHRKIGKKILGNKNWTNLVGSLLSELKTNQEDYNLNLNRDDFAFEPIEFNNLIEIIRKGKDLYSAYKPFAELSFLNPKKFVEENPFLVEEKINSDFNFYKEELQKINELKLKFKQDFNDIRLNQITNQEGQIKLILKNINSVFLNYKIGSDFYNEQKTKGIFYRAISLFSGSRSKVLRDQKTVTSNFKKLVKTIANSIDFENIVEAEKMISIYDLVNNYSLKMELLNNKFQNKIEDEFENLINGLDRRVTTQKNKVSINVNEQEINFQELNTICLTDLLNNINKLSNKIFNDSWIFKPIQWKSINDFIFQITSIINKKNNYFNNDTEIFSLEFNWHQYYNSLESKQKSIIDAIKEKSDWRKTFALYYFNSLLIKSADIDLPTDDKDHKQLDLSLRKLKKEQINYIQNYWYDKQIQSTKNFDSSNGSIVIENVYNKRSSRRHKRLSLREIVKLDIDLFTNFFPVILTTPDVASNLFSNRNEYFDIVMFDEASQLKIEDNLPALLKGKQIVIAGDEHQMPPSNYFSKLFDGTIEDEDEFEDEIEKIKSDASNSLLECESLLDFASELGFDKRYLDFHYRSNHPYLIDFSNYAFYNQRLKPIPNEFEYIPIKYIRVNGTYSGNSNESEAEMVLSIIEKNINRLPDGKYPTVGVATFNINQRNLILSKIYERKKFQLFNDFNNKMSELEEDGFFVKNLENIQGDERDVIILSTTYGVNSEGKFAQRFGSINHQKGYKLLNVIVTRAKYKIYVCSSIPEEVFLNYKEHLINEGSNNRRGVFFAYLSYAKAVSENDEESRATILKSLAENSTKKSSIDNFNNELESPFEEEVYEALLEHFDKFQIIPQLQFAGFRIDLVFDTKKPGVPKIAIECDGAKYHSSREAYLYDRHRQKILENHGFVFHRIWSTNWWRRPTQETKKLVDFINNLINNPTEKLKEKSNISLAFTNDYVNPLKDIRTEIPGDNSNIEAIIDRTILKSKPKKLKKPKKIVKLESVVKVKYLNNNKELTVQLVEHKPSKIEKSNGIQKINFKSPLGVSLIDKSIGSTVRIGDLDNYVKILEIK